MEKRALGRGLSALIPGSQSDTMPSGSGVELDVESIAFNPFQPRKTINDEKFRDLVNSIKVHGVLQPIVVRSSGNGLYELVAGERRLRASREAGLKSVPATIREFTDEQSLEVALIENLQREDINAIDAAIAYHKLSEDFSLSQEEIAFAIGKSRSSVANTVRLLNLPEDVQGELKRGRITEGHARAILTLDDANDQRALAKTIVEGALSVRDAERLSREWTRRAIAQETGIVSRETIPERKDPNMLELEARLREIYGTKVNIVNNRNKGRIELEFYTEDDLGRLLCLMLGE